MRYYNYPTYENNPGTGSPCGTMVPTPQNTGLSIRSSRLLAHSVEHENARAILTSTAMQNTATLFALGEQLSDAVPSSQEALRTMAQAYAYASSKQILNW